MPLQQSYIMPHIMVTPTSDTTAHNTFFDTTDEAVNSAVYRV